MQHKITITVDKPNNLPEGLNTMFNSSIAISNAIAKFWDLNLAHTATLGDVRELDNSFEVDITYRTHKLKVC
jgi:hypothetical protein